MFVKYIKHHDGTRIAQMSAVIDGGPTDIDAHPIGNNRLKDLFLAGLRVIELDLGHSVLTHVFRVAGLATLSMV